MPNKREELAEYIIKNLLFMVVFLFVIAYVFSGIILPKVNMYKDKKNDLRYTQLAYAKTLEQNKLLNQKIETDQQNNQKLLTLLKNPPAATKIHALAQEFFEVNSLKQIERKKEEIFVDRIFRMQGKIKNPQDFFNFTKKLKILYPNITLILPFEMKKQNPLDSILDLTFHFKITQIDQT
ncbi:hypothetical protein [Helicobacter cholecystus]|uniref:hypothetical protein n=1 Tax=Helicobacter cholecystus TaxID=45498 RepID=UPI0027395323|nr:hypothetical protein [Helicobacter cholecystus]